MSTEITKEDYIKILQFYNIKIPDSIKAIKNAAEDILAQKLCRCIKKSSAFAEPRSIGICTKTIFNAKGLSRGKFSCKPKVEFRKQTKQTKRNKRTKTQKSKRK